MTRRNSGDRSKADVSANLVGFAASLIVALATIPLLVRFLGTEGYGAWLVVSAVPTYLVLTDLGLATAGSVRVTQLVAELKFAEARSLYWSYCCCTWLVVSGIGGVLALSIPLSGVEALGDVRLNLLLAAWVALAYGASLLEGGFRATRRFASGVLGVTALRVADAAAVVTAAAISSDLVEVAAAQLLSRVVGTAILVAVFRRRAKVLATRPQRLQVRALGSLLVPGLGFVLAPGAQLVIVQGSTLLGGIFLSAEELIIFVAARTLVGLLRQVGQTIGFGFFSELSLARAERAADRMEHLTARMNAAVAMVSGVGVIALLALGPAFLAWWTGFSRPGLTTVLGVLTVYALGETLWNNRLVIRMAGNEHTRLALLQMAHAIVGLLLAWGMVAKVGIVGLALGLAGYGLLLVTTLVAQRRCGLNSF